MASNVSRSARRYLTSAVIFSAIFIAVVWFTASPNYAAAPTLSGGAPANAATAVAVNASISIVSDVDLSAPSVYGWSSQTTAESSSLTDVHLVDTSTGYAVGSNSKLFKTTNGGSTWALISGLTFAQPPQVTHFFDANTGWVAGNVGTIQKTTDGGTTLTAQTSNISTTIRGMYFVDANIGYVVAAGGYVSKTTNGGTTWANASAGGEGALGAGDDLYSVHCADATCWVVGANGAILQTTTAGTPWNVQTSGVATTLQAVYATDANTAFVVGTNGVIRKTTNGGTTWTAQTSGVASILNAVQCTDASTCWIAGDSGVILKTTNGGTTWTAQTSGTSAALAAISFVSGSLGVAVGADTFVRYVPTVLLQTNTGNAQIGAATGSDLCTTVTLTASRTIACTHADLSKNTWYTFTLKGGSSGVTATGGAPNTMASDTTRAFRTIGAPALATASFTNEQLAIATDAATTVDFDNPLNGGTLIGTTWENGVTSYLNDVQFHDGTLVGAVGNGGMIVRSADSGATWVRSTAGSTNLNALAMLSSGGTGWIVGDSGTIRKTTDAGVTTTAQTSGTSNNLTEVAAVDLNTVYVVGSVGTILKTTNGGTTWTAQTSGVATPLLGIYATDANTVFVVGDSGTILKTTNGGTTWTAQTSGVSSYLEAVTCTDASTCWAIGESGAILKTTNGGITWTAQTSGVSAGLRNISCVDTSTCWIVGASGAAGRTTNGGTTWTFATPVTVELNGVSFVSTTTGVAVGAEGHIIRSTNGGASWTTINTATFPSPQVFNAVSVPTAATAYAVGDSGMMLKTTTGGFTWTSVASGTAANLHDVAFGDASTGIVVGTSGLIQVTLNGGTSWLTQTSGTSENLHSIVRSSDDAADYAAGGSASSAVVLKSTNDGETWSAVTPSGLASELSDIACSDANTCIAVGDGGRIRTTTNGGTSWSSPASGTGQDLERISCLEAPDAATCWVVGGESGTAIILKTTDGGTTWSSQTSPVSQYLYGVIAGNTSTALAVGVGGTIIRTSDGGTTWTSDTSGTTAVLRAIAIRADAVSDGYVVGESSTIRTVRRNIRLEQNTGVLRAGAVSGPNFCAAITLGSDGSGNSSRRITCTHGTLVPGAWYTLTVTGGSGGVASTSNDVLAATVTRT
ncbi:MAG: YCF48-related protein, partial [bacterium]|nr:YCF48-related protein [bacterium]